MHCVKVFPMTLFIVVFSNLTEPNPTQQIWLKIIFGECECVLKVKSNTSHMMDAENANDK